MMNPGPHGFSEVLYCLEFCRQTTMAAPSPGAGLPHPFLQFVAQYCDVGSQVLADSPSTGPAGSFAAARKTPPSAGTLPTHTPLFGAWLLAVVVMVGALSFLPALALGPIIEHLILA